MRLNVVFDVDGVLVDSKELNRRAYAAVGVDIPDDAFGKPWHHWLVDYCNGNVEKAKYLHVKKQQWQLSQSINREEVPLLPATHIARAFLMLDRDINVKFLSASSEAAMRMNVAYSGLPFAYCNTSACEIGAEAKNVALQLMTEGGVYVDDDEELGRRCVDGTKFSLVRYHGQTTLELMDEIWTQLYSRLARVPASKV